MLKKISSNTYNKLFFLFAFVIFFAILSFFKYSIKDEVLYLQETLLISELIKSGHWIGSYGVATHGFIYKLPLAIVYVFTGPSTFWSSLYSSFFSGLSVIFLYAMCKKHLNMSRLNAVLVCVLFTTSMQFINTTFTYLREPFSVFSILFFVWTVFEKRSSLLSGIALLLILDSKEHYFYSTFLAYVIYLIFTTLQTRKIKESIKHLIVISTPAILYTILMFYTNIIPVNTYNAFVLGMIDRGFQPQLKQIRDGNNNNINIDQITEDVFTSSPVRLKVFKVTQDIRIHRSPLNEIKGYILKPFYQRTFGHLAVLISVVFISVAGAFYYLFKDKDKLRLISIILIVNLGIYLLYYSHGRYLLPTTPFIFILFMKFLTGNFKYARPVIMLAIILGFIEYLFELNYLMPKLIITAVISASFLIYMVFKNRIKNSQIIPISAVAVFSVMTGFLYLYTTEQGQIKKALVFGTDGEINKIAKLLNSEDTVYTNENARLLAFYRKNLSLNPEEKYKLKDNLPRRKSLKTYSPEKTFAVYYKNNQCNYETPAQHGTVVLFKSTKEGMKYNSEYCINYLADYPGVKLENILNMKNKQVYVYKVN